MISQYRNREFTRRLKTAVPFSKFSHGFSSAQPGDYVAVRPCAEKYGDKTYLGMYLCDAPTGVIGKQVGEELVLELNDFTNPAIFIPEFNEIIWGAESWWSKIESPDDLKQITDADIENAWYVKALKKIEEENVRDTKADA